MDKCIKRIKASETEESDDDDDEPVAGLNLHHTFGSGSCLRTVGTLDVSRKRTNSEEEVDAIKRAKEEHNHYDELD